MSIIKKARLVYQGDGRSAIVKKNAIGSLVIKGISIVVSLALVPLTIGYVSSELYGVWLTLSSILTWLSFLDIGFSQGLKNKLTEAIAHEDWEKGKALVSTTYFMMILIFLPVCLIFEAVIPFVDWCSLLNVSTQYLSEIVKAMHILIAMACLQMIVHVLISVIAAFQRVALSNIFLPVGNIISLIIIYVLTKVCPPSLIALCFSLAAMPILVMIIASVVLYKGAFNKVAPSISKIDRVYIKELWGLGYKFFIINIQIVVLYQSTNILISNVSSPNDVTIYNIAYKFLSVAMMVFNLIIAPLWPAYTDAYTRGDYSWMKNMRSKMRKILLLSIVGCVVAVLLSPVVYDIWIGNRVSIPLLMTIMVALYVSMFCWMQLNGTMLVGMSKVKIETIMAVIGMVTHIPLAYLLGQFIGAYGVIISMILINLVYALIFEIQVNKLLNKTAKGVWNA